MKSISARARLVFALKSTTAAAAVLVAATASSPAQEAVENGSSLRLMNLNIWNKFKQNPELVTDYMVRGNYDLLMFQEVGGSKYVTHIPDILKAAGLGTYTGIEQGSSGLVSRKAGEMGVFVAPGIGSQGRDVPFTRIYAEVDRPETVVGTVHMDWHDGSTERLQEAKAISDWARQINGPLIMSGDFNAGDVSERGLHRIEQQFLIFKGADSNSFYRDLARQYLQNGDEAKTREVVQQAFQGQDIDQLSWGEWASALETAYRDGEDIGLRDETYAVAGNTPQTMNVLKKQFMLMQTDAERERFAPHELNDGSATWPSAGEDKENQWASWDRVRIDHFMAARPFGKWYKIIDDPQDKTLGTLRDLYATDVDGVRRPISDHESVAHEFQWVGPKLERYSDAGSAKTRLVWGEGAHDFAGRNKEFFLTRNNNRNDVYLGQIADENGNPILTDLTLDEKKTLLHCRSKDARFQQAIKDYCIDDHSFIGETLVTDGGTLIVDEDAALGGVDADLRLANGGLRVIGTGMTSLDRETKLDGAGFIEVADASNDVSAKREISGAGGLAKRGAGTLTLDARNSYAGGTLVEAGTLRAGVAGALVDGTHYTVNAGQLDLNGHDLNAASLSGLGGSVTLGAATLTLDQAQATRFDGAIAGAGGVVKEGKGTLVLNGANSYAGVTDIRAGGLVVGDANHADASLAGRVTLADGAFIGGRGSLGALDVAKGATVAPGNSIGALNITGDVTLAAGSTYQVEIAPSGEGDKIIAGGKATIDGANVYVAKQAGTYTPGRRYEILTAQGGVDGRFAALDQNLPFIDLGLAYDPRSVYLDVARNEAEFVSAALTSNQHVVANAVEALGSGNAVYDAVVWQPDETAARQAYDALSGEIHAATQTALINESGALRSAVNDRIRAAFATQSSQALPVMSYAAGDKTVAAPGAAGPVLWTQAFGVWGETNATSQTAGMDQSSGGIIAGYDGALTENWRLGLMAGYSRSSIDLDARASSADSDNFHLGIYGGGQWGATALRAGLSYSWHSIETSRAVRLPGFAETLTGDTDANTFQAFGELAHSFDLGGTMLEPFANLAHVSLDMDGLGEQGGAAALGIAGSSMDTTFTTLGLRVAAPFELGSVQAQARGLIGWQHAFGDTQAVSTAAFAGGAGFDVIGAGVAEDVAVIEAGLDLDLSDRAKLGVQYGGQFGSGFSQNAVKAKFSLNF